MVYREGVYRGVMGDIGRYRHRVASSDLSVALQGCGLPRLASLILSLIYLILSLIYLILSRLACSSG